MPKSLRLAVNTFWLNIEMVIGDRTNNKITIGINKRTKKLLYTPNFLEDRISGNDTSTVHSSTSVFAFQISIFTSYLNSLV